MLKRRVSLPVRRFPIRLAFLVLSLLLGACEFWVLDPEAENYEIEINQGQDQKGLVGTTLPLPLSIKVYGEKNFQGGAVDVPITWHVVKGGGTIRPRLHERPGHPPTGMLTDHQGYASAEWTLGPEPGDQLAYATIDGQAPKGVNDVYGIPIKNQARFRATAISNGVATITLAPDSAVLSPGETRRFSVVLRNQLGDVVSGRNITFFSSNVNVVRAEPARLEATGVSAGQADLVVQSEGKEARARVRVVARPVHTIALAPGDTTVAVGQTFQLRATLRDEAGNLLTGRAIEWQSSNPAFSSVSPDGVVNAVAQGTAQITASSEGRSAASTVVVRATQTPGSTTRLSATVVYTHKRLANGEVQTFPDEVYAGDHEANGDRTIQGFVAYGLSTIPAGATLQSARLTVSQVASATVGSPFALGTLLVERAIQGVLSEQAPQAGAVPVATAPFGSTSMDVTQLVREARTAGQTSVQFRFRFQQLQNNNGQTDYLQLTPGTLEVTYQP